MGGWGPKIPLLAWALKVSCPGPDGSLARKCRRPLLHPTPRQDPTDSVTGYTTQGQETREKTSAGSEAVSPGPPLKGFGAEHVRAAAGPNHCDTAAPAQSPPPGRHMLPERTAGWRPAHQPLSRGPGGPPPTLRTRQERVRLRPVPSLRHSPRRARPN